VRLSSFLGSFEIRATVWNSQSLTQSSDSR
jgi:hypothetical protein